MAPTELQRFLARTSLAAAPPPLPASFTPLDTEAVYKIEYRLAEAGFALKPIAFNKAASLEQPYLYVNGVLFCAPGAVDEPGKYAAHLLFELVYRPLCGEDPAGRAAALVLTLKHLAVADLEPWSPPGEAAALLAYLHRTPPHDLATALPDQAVPDNLAARIAQAESRLAQEERRPSRRLTLPAVRVTPDTLTRFDLPARGIGWVADRFGWVRARPGAPWQGGFLPLQVLGIAKGLLGARLLHSGVVAAPTSAGKTLLAELRMLARWFRPDLSRKKTVMLVPTREIGLERWAEMEGAYGVGDAKKKGKRLTVCYSDGDHHGHDWLIAEGKFDLAIMVNEKFRFFQQRPAFLKEVGEVVIDELELMSSEGRGIYLETALMSIVQHKHPVTVLALTRPSSGLSSLLQALRRDGAPPFHLEVLERPVPMAVGLWDARRGIARYRHCNSGRVHEETLALPYPGRLRDTLRQLLIAFVKQTPDEAAAGLRNNLVIAAPTKRDLTNITTLLGLLYLEDDEAYDILHANSRTVLIEERLRSLEPTQRQLMLGKLLPCGIGFHDADLSPAERKLVSRSFRAGELSVLVCTQTMAHGVNLPAQSIVFLGWGLRPSSGRSGPPRPAYYHKLQDDFVTWLGRVGRYGQPTHRLAHALYLSIGGPDTFEYDLIWGLILETRTRFVTHLEKSGSFEQPLLYALRTLRQALDEAPTWDHLAAFFLAAPTAHEMGSAVLLRKVFTALMRLGAFRYAPPFREAYQLRQAGTPIDHGLQQRLLERAPAYKALLDEGRLDELLKTPAFRVAFIAESDEADQVPGGVRLVDRAGNPAFAITRLGALACAHGVSMETCVLLYEWLRRHQGAAWGWDVLDLLVLVRQTPDGASIRGFGVHPSRRKDVRRKYDAYLAEAAHRMGDAWRDRSVALQADLSDTFAMAMLLAMADWRKGVPLHGPWETPGVPRPYDIEATYGLRPYGTSVYTTARDFARLLRLTAAIARVLPENGHPPERPAVPPLSQGVVCVPYDLEPLSLEMLYGVPEPATDLARTNIDGLARAWTLALFQAVEDRNVAPDLPLLERVRLLSEEAGALAAVLPTPGLAARITTELNEKPRAPLGDPLRTDPTLLETFYGHPLVRRVHLWQGADRFTALRMIHRGLYTVFRRNEINREPIVLEDETRLADWLRRGAVEFLAEIGAPTGDGYGTDRFVVDLDPKNDYPLPALRLLLRDLTRRLSRHRWVNPDHVFVHCTGGRGFHVVAHFRENTFRPIDRVKTALTLLLRDVCNDVSVFLQDQPSIFDPFVVLDLSVVKARGVYRNVFSLNASTGRACVPVPLDRLASFDPEQETEPSHVLSVLESIRVEEKTPYPEFLRLYASAV